MQRVHITNYKLKDEQVNEYIKNNPVSLPDDFLNVLRDFPSLNTTQAMYVPLYMRLTGSPMFKTAFSKALGTDKGIYFELSTVANVLNGINDFTPVTEEQFIEVNKNIKEIVNTDTAIINCGAYGKGRIYHLEYTKLADSERGRL